MRRNLFLATVAATKLLHGMSVVGCVTLGSGFFFVQLVSQKKWRDKLQEKCCWHGKISWMFHWWLFIRFSAEVKIFLNETNVLWVEVFPSFKRHVTDFVAPFAFSFVIFSSEYYRLAFCKEAFLSFVVIADFQSALLFFFFLYVIIWQKPGRMYVDLTNLSLHVFVILKTCMSGHSMLFFLIYCFYFIIIFFCIITVMKIILLNLTFIYFLWPSACT